MIKEYDLALAPDMLPQYPGWETMPDMAKSSILFNLICFSDLLSFNQSTGRIKVHKLETLKDFPHLNFMAFNAAVDASFILIYEGN